MEVPAVTTAGHVVVVPYPSRGHINPMMNLSKLLVSKNSDILVTFVVTEQWLGFLGSEPKPSNIQVGSIPSVTSPELAPVEFLVMIEAVMTKMEAPFERLLDRLEPPPTMIIYDNFLFWVVPVGNRRNIPVASFWTSSTLCFWVQQHYHLLEQNHLLENGEKLVDCIPGICAMRVVDIPFLDGSWHSQQIIQWAKKASQWVRKAQYLLFYSIYELEPEVIDVLKMKFSMPVYTIGPTMACFSLEDNSSLNSSISGNNYLQWLDCQPSNSVLYISHGSFCSVSRAQIDEIAAGLCDSGVRFLWIAREEASRLKEIGGDMGLVLAWCDQLRVLLHPAIGGFWTHCGWNSIMEGVFAGVPFLTFPITADQPLNSKVIEDWKVGWRVKKDFKVDTLVTKDDIADLLKKFMDLESDVGRDLRKRAKELQHIFQLAIANHGSSETNINAFVNDIISDVLP